MTRSGSAQRALDKRAALEAIREVLDQVAVVGVVTEDARRKMNRRLDKVMEARR